MSDGVTVDLHLLSLLDGTSEPLVATDSDENVARLSPDGRWLAYESNASGQFEIYVRPFPNVDDGRWLVSRGGGRRPVWAQAVDELFYMAPGARLMSVRVDTEPSFNPGSATELFSGYFDLFHGSTYDVAPDGQRFLMIKDAESSDDAFVLVHNWFTELERLVPTN